MRERSATASRAAPRALAGRDDARERLGAALREGVELTHREGARRGRAVRQPRAAAPPSTDAQRNHHGLRRLATLEPRAHLGVARPALMLAISTAEESCASRKIDGRWSVIVSSRSAAPETPSPREATPAQWSPCTIKSATGGEALVRVVEHHLDDGVAVIGGVEALQRDVRSEIPRDALAAVVVADGAMGATGAHGALLRGRRRWRRQREEPRRERDPTGAGVVERRGESATRSTGAGMIDGVRGDIGIDTRGASMIAGAGGSGCSGFAVIVGAGAGFVSAGAGAGSVADTGGFAVGSAVGGGAVIGGGGAGAVLWVCGSSVKLTRGSRGSGRVDGGV